MTPEFYYDTMFWDAVRMHGNPRNFPEMQDIHFCLQYTKEAFATAWNAIKNEYIFIIDNRTHGDDGAPTEETD